MSEPTEAAMNETPSSLEEGAATQPSASDSASGEASADGGECGTGGCGSEACAPASQLVRSTLVGGAAPIKLPPRPPQQNARPVQSNIPSERSERERMRQIAATRVADLGLVPPLSLAQLREHAIGVCVTGKFDFKQADFAAVLVNNEVWRESLAQVPFGRRLLLMPKCLRVEELCPAPFDEFGLLCKECGLCSLEDLTREAEGLGYAVLIAEGSSLITSMVATGKIEAIVGVSCLNVLERCFPHMEAVAIPGMSIPLLQDDCIDTAVDLDMVRDLIHLTAEDRTYRLDLEVLKRDVRTWFERDAIDRTMGEAQGETEVIARDWLARAGKRWRPFLVTCMWVALTSEGKRIADLKNPDLHKLAIAVECFHKASLIHDDIEDGDLERYGEPALHAEYGIPVALNVGDLLLGEGYRLISELNVDGNVKAEMMRVAAQGHVSLSRGQGAELCWARNPRPLTSLDVLGIFREKTAPAFEVALRLGALFGGAESDLLDVLGPYSEALGIAYQINDDLDDHDGQSDSDDLEDMRPSLILAIALKRAKDGPEKEMMERLWRRELDPGTFKTQVRPALMKLLDERGVLSKARELSDAYEREAIKALEPLTHPTAKGLLRRVIGKIFGDEPPMEGYCSEFEARNAAGRASGATPAS